MPTILQGIQPGGEVRAARLIERLYDAWDLINSGDADTEAIAEFFACFDRLIILGARFTPAFRAVVAALRQIMVTRDTDDFAEDGGPEDG